MPIAAAAALAGCSRHSGNVAPPRVDAPAALPAESSRIVVPVTTGLDSLAAALDAETPRTLWQVDEHKPDCVPAQRVDLKFVKLKIVPTLGCQIVGTVTRGPIRLSGEGNRLVITLPVTARVSARNIGGLVKQETATGAADVRAVARLGISGNWTPTAKVDIAYDWTKAPGVTVLGQRIEFAGKADDKLHAIIAKLERDLPRQLAKLDLHDKLAGVWRRGFTTIELNRDRPPAWMRITPQRLGFGGYRVEGRTLTLTLAAEAQTATFVGPRPAAPVPTPLPPPSATIGERGLSFFIPVLADYSQLQPVIEDALRRRAAKGIVLPGIGPVDAKFGHVTIYATTGNRLAVGIHVRVRAKGRGYTTTTGDVWLSALPYNKAGTQLVAVRDLQIATDTDSSLANILVRLFADGGVQNSIRTSLAHDFAPDYAKVLHAARGAIGGRREGDFLLAADVTRVTTGELRVTGAGLFLPVQAEGQATIRYAPR